jgi:transcriptional regulator with XRE-family HTH domain
MVLSISPRLLGQRIRQLRTHRSMTQEELAGGDYSKSYISAIEQGKTRPSLQALQRLASRLGVSPGSLLEPDTSGAVPDDPDLLRRRVRRPRAERVGTLGGRAQSSSQDFQLDRAELSIYADQPEEALGLLAPLLQTILEHGPAEVGPGKARASRKSGTVVGPSLGVGVVPGGEMSAANLTRPLNLNRTQLQRALYLAALAHMQAAEASVASQYAQRGMQEATQNDDLQGLARCRMVLGNAYRNAGQPLSAVEQHQACLEAATTGIVRDPQFRLAVLSELLEDYLALRDYERAWAIYEESRSLLEELSRLEGHARLLRAAFEHNEAQHDATVSLRAGKAIAIYQTLESMRSVAKVLRTSSTMLAERGELEEAEGQLQLSLAVAEGLNSSLDRAEAFIELARLALGRGDNEGAARQAELAISLCRLPAQDGKHREHREHREHVRAAATGTGTGTGKKSPGNTRRTLQISRALVRALAVAGEAATRQGNESKADEAFQEALKLLESGVNVENASEIYRTYAQVLAAHGDHEKALSYFERAYKSVFQQLR